MTTGIQPTALMVATREQLAAARARAEERADDPVAVVSLLEAWGRALACGALGETDSATPKVTPGQVALALAHESMDLARLEEAGVAIAEALDEDREEGEDAKATISKALHARDRVEHVLLAAEQATGAPAALTVDQEIFVVEFEHLVRPLLARLTAFNDLRGESAARVSPPLRARFWWCCEGAGIAPGAWAGLAPVAELVVRFPDARERLDALIRTVETLAASKTSRSNVSYIDVFVAARREVSGALNIAAASGDERLDVVKTRDYEISLRPPDTLVIDLFVEPRAGATPHARLPSGRRLASTLVPRTVHRYRVTLDERARAEEGCVVVIPLPAGDIDVAFPPAEP